MLEKILILVLIAILVFFIYDFVRNIWAMDICLSYYQRYGNYTYTNPFDEKSVNTLDCYHEALNYMVVYMVAIVLISLLIGFFLGFFREYKIISEKMPE